MTPLETICHHIDLFLQAHAPLVMIFSVLVFAGVWVLVIHTWSCDENLEER